MVYMREVNSTSQEILKKSILDQSTDFLNFFLQI